MTATATKPTRVRRTPAQRAQVELDAAQTRYARAVKLRDRLKTELTAAQAECEAAERLVMHAANHPDLPRSGSLDPDEMVPAGASHSFDEHA